MADTNRLVLPLLAASQAQKHVTVNEALKLLDVIIQAGVIDKDLTSPPGSPTEGDVYIVGASATGSWDGQDDDLAIYQDGVWVFITPLDGFIAFVADESTLYVYNSGWTSLAGLLGSGYLSTGGGTLTGNLVLEEATPSIRFNDTDLTGYSLLQTVGAKFQVSVDAEGDEAGSSFTVAIDGSDKIEVNQYGLGIGGTSADANNVMSVYGTNALFNSGGSFNFKFNKNASVDDASLTFQTGLSTRALVGLLADDDLTFKVSPDGSTYHTAMVIDKGTGDVSFPVANPLKSYASNLYADSGRMGDGTSYSNAGSFVFPSYMLVGNSAASSAVAKFIFDNTDYGGTAGSLNAYVKELIDKIRNVGARRWNIEFWVAQITAGAGTSGSPITVGSDTGYYSLVHGLNMRPFALTHQIYMKAIDDNVLVVVGTGRKIFKDGIEQTVNFAVTPADGWVHLLTHDTTPVRDSVGYQPNIFAYHSLGSGDRYLLACPMLTPGLVAIDPDTGIVPSFNIWS